MKFFISFFFLFFTIITTAQVPDGIYLAYGPEVLSVDGKVIKYSHRFIESTLDDPDYIVIDTTDFVPLDLKMPPDSTSKMMGQPEQMLLMITLTDEAAIKMENFTGKNIDKKVAIVIGGEAVTIHKIREKITGGKLQITRCTDNACKFLFLELKDNVKSNK